MDGRGDTFEVAVDAVFDALADQRRRHVLSCLLEADRALELSDLALTVAEREADAPDGEVDRDTVREIHTSLYHVHVPKLAAAGVVEYDRDRNLVRASAGGDQFDRVVALADGVVASHDAP